MYCIGNQTIGVITWKVGFRAIYICTAVPTPTTNYQRPDTTPPARPALHCLHQTLTGDFGLTRVL